MKELLKAIKPYAVFIFALLGGSILPFGFSPFYLGFAGLISPGILLWCLAHRSPSKSFLIGWCYGIALFGIGTHWIYVSIHDYGSAPTWLAGGLTGIFILFMALYFAVMSALLTFFFPKNNSARCLLAYPVLWTAFEILRGWFLTGFPWLFVGYSQVGNHLRYFAPVGSVWAISWATVLISSALYCLVLYYYDNQKNKFLRNSFILVIIAVWSVGLGLRQIIWTIPSDQNVIVALAQGNIPQLMRWDPEHENNILQSYVTLTQQAQQEALANVIIWPEGAIPIPLPTSQHFFEEMDKYAKEHQLAIISGVPVKVPQQASYYNALLSFGLGSGIYYKALLVPFGEYVPFERWLRGTIAFFDLPMSSFISGPKDQKPLIAQGFSFAPLICYEIAYPIYVQQMSQNADFILTVSNDTWFGKSIGPAQHLQIAQVRALETGKYVIRATNSGFTAIIEPNSNIQAFAPQFKKTLLNGRIVRMQGETFWSKYGIIPLGIMLMATLALGFTFKNK